MSKPGVRMTGTGFLVLIGNRFSAVLDITGSTGEYVAGRINIDLGTDATALAGPANGTLDVKRTGTTKRVFNGSFDILHASFAQSVHCTQFRFDVANSTREYTGGSITLTMDIENPDPSLRRMTGHLLV